MSEPVANSFGVPIDAASPARFPVVNLAQAAVLESSLRSLPPDFMHRFKVVPFSVDKYSRRASIACANPGDPELPGQLAGHFPGYNISLYQAEADAVDRLIARMTAPAVMPVSVPEPPAPAPPVQGAELQSEPFHTFNPVPDFLDEITLDHEPASDSGPIETEAASEGPILLPFQANTGETSAAVDTRKVVLFITQSGKISQHLLFALTAERMAPRVVSSPEAALAEIESRPAESVFIEKGLRSRCEPMLIKLRAQSPGITVRFFATEASLLLNTTTEDLNHDLFQKNLQLLRHLTSGEKSTAAHHAATVARFADGVCTRLNLPNHVRQAVITAAFLHNLAEESLVSSEGFERADIIGLSAGRLSGWDYPPLVVQLLRRMYHEIPTDPLRAAGVESVGGGVLTATDCFCHTWPDISGISARNLHQVEQKLLEQVAGCVSPGIMEALIDSICDELTAQMLRHAPFRVQVLLSRGMLSPGLDMVLRGASFSVDISSSIDDCARFCRRFNPKVLVVRDSGSVQDVYDIIIGLAVRGVALDRLSTVMLLEREVVGEATRLLRHGVEDILPHDADPLALLAKLERIRARIDDSARERLAVLRDLGTHGTLEDMNLIDLLEVWRSNKRPVRIAVSAHGTQLVVYVDRGKILYAECDDRSGADAILKGIAWRKGAWSIDTVDTSDLPAPNVDQDIDAVLLDACVRLDKASLLDRA